MKNIFLNISISLISITILFIVIRFILNKTNYFKGRRLVRNVFSCFIALVLYFSCSILFFNNLTKTPKDSKFNESIWKDNISERHKMINDLLASDYLIGKTENKIKEVFGEPKKILGSDNNILVYDLIDRSWSEFKIIELKLYFKNNTLIKYEHYNQNK